MPHHQGAVKCPRVLLGGYLPCLDQFVRLIREKVAGIDYDFLNWVIEDAAAHEG